MINVIVFVFANIGKSGKSVTLKGTNKLIAL